MHLAQELPVWFAAQARPLPWRADNDPYHVWISEIMLQQTRVEAVVGYYLRFLDALPTLHALAAVEEEQLLKLWEGLGYYNRARNLQKAAQQIEAQHGGVFPRAYAEIRALPGIGPYTAGAIGSICFDLPTPAVDGNVLRVVTRYEADESNIDREATKKQIAARLTPLYRPGLCGVMTQSLMELGACVCVPNGAPHCERCPLKATCRSAGGGWMRLPVRDAKKARKQIEKTVLILQCGDRVAIRKRKSTGLLANLWEFPNYDVPAAETPAQAQQAAQALCGTPVTLLDAQQYTHIFTHVEWHMTAFRFSCGALPPAYTAATAAELEHVYALPSAFRPFFE
ncbi:MAG: A/G-specific adenine glycosylase [Clostridia bacterium]|nr:A/G-specific adenine glycosylase [Clostridia bacterium]